jgi:hypothetical protein
MSPADVGAQQCLELQISDRLALARLTKAGA